MLLVDMAPRSLVHICGYILQFEAAFRVHGARGLNQQSLCHLLQPHLLSIQFMLPRALVLRVNSPKARESRADTRGSTQRLRWRV